jgi:hypothetical protein
VKRGHPGIGEHENGSSGMAAMVPFQKRGDLFSDGRTFVSNDNDNVNDKTLLFVRNGLVDERKAASRCSIVLS